MEHLWKSEPTLATIQFSTRGIDSISTRSRRFTKVVYRKSISYSVCIRACKFYTTAGSQPITNSFLRIATIQFPVPGFAILLRRSRRPMKEEYKKPISYSLCIHACKFYTTTGSQPITNSFLYMMLLSCQKVVDVLHKYP